MRSTLRKRGEHMITVRPRFDLDGDTVTRMIARECWNEANDWGEAEQPADLSRKQAEQALVDFLQTYGWSELDDWATNVAFDQEEQERAWIWARRQALRFWPDLTIRAAMP